MIFFTPEKIRQDFPFFKHNPGVTYFDNACMTLKPQTVIDALQDYYNHSACAGRSHHQLAENINEKILNARTTIRKFINAHHNEEILFTRNTTEGINLLAQSMQFQPGDEVIITDKEHNSNLVPWIRLQKKKKITLKILPSNKDNTFNFAAYEQLLTEKTKLVALHHRSNLDGVTLPAKKIIQKAHDNNTLVMLDGAQATPSMEINLKELDADFYAFSGHKLCGPTGTGILYGKKEQLEQLEPYNLGGETVTNTTYDHYELKPLPERFEAGLQDYAGILGLAAAINYLKKIGMDTISNHEEKLNKIMTEELKEVITILGPEDHKQRSNILSFTIQNLDIHNIARILSTGEKIMTRSGAHCVHAWFNNHQLPGSIRASIYFYNTD